MKTFLSTVVLASLTTVAYTQTTDVPQPRPSTAPAPGADRSSHIDFSLMNAFDGNINHDPEPVRSYGLAPGASFRYEHRSFEFGYDVAFNRYTNTDDSGSDRPGQIYAMAIQRAGPVRFETGGNVTLKGSSEDRELANEYAVL